MNGSLESINKWVIAFTGFMEIPVEMAVCPPFVYLRYFKSRLLEAAITMNVGAQNCSQFLSGAYTGEISAQMLQDLGVPWVILGHSERRQYFSETNVIVAHKTRTALDCGRRPIVCVGETLKQRQEGNTKQVIGEQLDEVLKVVKPEELVNGAIAYEPVWAIGTGVTATPEQAEEVHKFIRDSVKSHDSQAAQDLRIIYGGSVKPSNAADLFACPDIDGGLIGGASLKAADFFTIAQAAIQLSMY